MNVKEFRAWLLGFERKFYWGRPNSVQWAEIRKRLAELEGELPHVIIVTPNADLGVHRDMRVVALDAEVYDAIKGVSPGDKRQVNHGNISNTARK